MTQILGTTAIDFLLLGILFGRIGSSDIVVSIVCLVLCILYGTFVWNKFKRNLKIVEGIDDMRKMR